MIIRDATEDDFLDLVSIGSDFAAAAGMPEVDVDTLVTTLRTLMDSGVLKVAENGEIAGTIGALVFPHYWNVNEVVAQELFWWIREEYRGTSAGIRLLNACEKECQGMGAKKLMMLCLDNLDGDKVANLYRRRGYEPQEQTFIKVL